VAVVGASLLSPLSELSNRKTSRSLASIGAFAWDDCTVEVKVAPFSPFELSVLAKTMCLYQAPASNTESVIKKTIQRNFFCKVIAVISFLFKWMKSPFPCAVVVFGLHAEQRRRGSTQRNHLAAKLRWLAADAKRSLFLLVH
jgi:hypothetical protein